MIKHLFNNIKTWLQSLSFRTGVIVLLCCIPFYILSFAQMRLPTSAAAKGVLWTILFGLAKTCQYGGLTILGVEGFNRLKNWIKREKGYEQKNQEGIAYRHGIYYAGHGGCHDVHGIFSSIIDFCFSKDANIRIDTHLDNRIMQHVIKKYGFTYCGIIYLAGVLSTRCHLYIGPPKGKENKAR